MKWPFTLSPFLEVLLQKKGFHLIMELTVTTPIKKLYQTEKIYAKYANLIQIVRVENIIEGK